LFINKPSETKACFVYSESEEKEEKIQLVLLI